MPALANNSFNLANLVASGFTSTGAGGATFASCTGACAAFAFLLAATYPPAAPSARGIRGKTSSSF